MVQIVPLNSLIFPSLVTIEPLSPSPWFIGYSHVKFSFSEDNFLSVYNVKCILKDEDWDVFVDLFYYREISNEQLLEDQGAAD